MDPVPPLSIVVDDLPAARDLLSDEDPVRDVRDLPNVVGDVLSDDPISSRHASDELSVLVDELHRGPVYLVREHELSGSRRLRPFEQFSRGVRLG